MSKKTKFALMLSVVFSLVFGIAPIVGNCLLYNELPDPFAYLCVLVFAFLIFLTTSIGYEAGYSAAKEQ